MWMSVYAASMHIFIYIWIVCLFVCLFVSNKFQNGWTDQAHGAKERFIDGLHWIEKLLPGKERKAQTQNINW